MKTTRRKCPHDISHPPLNEPTKERREKPDYEAVGGKRLKLNTVSTLHKAGDISGEAVTAATRWYVDYVFATYGYADFLRDILPATYIKGDRHTFGLGRAKAAQRISQARQCLGSCGHQRLEMMLGREMSFSAMADYFYPESSEGRARMKISAQCALLLEQLADFYLGQKKHLKREKTLV